VHGALQEIEQPVAALVEAGLTPQQAVDTYGAISVHTRGSVVLQRFRKQPVRNNTVAGRGIGFADDIDFDYITRQHPRPRGRSDQPFHGFGLTNPPAVTRNWVPVM